MPQLTKRQKDVLPYVKWLFYGPRQTGRTVVCAMAAIQHAIEFPGMAVKLHDHDHYFVRREEGETYLRDRVIDVLETFPEEERKRFSIRHTDNTLTYMPTPSRVFLKGEWND